MIKKALFFRKLLVPFVRLRAKGAKKYQGQGGGVALEYVLVSTFAAIASVALLGLASQIFKTRLHILAEKLGLSLEEVSFNPFAEGE